MLLALSVGLGLVFGFDNGLPLLAIMLSGMAATLVGARVFSKFAPRGRRIGNIVLAVIVVGVLSWAVSEIIPKSRYGCAARRINEKICSLRERRPVAVSEKLWEDRVAWASIAHCNICFSEGHTKYSEMLRFENELDEKLKGPVDLDALNWIGERAAQTGPHGEQYMIKVKWREQWENIIQTAHQ